MKNIQRRQILSGVMGGVMACSMMSGVGMSTSVSALVKEKTRLTPEILVENAEVGLEKPFELSWRSENETGRVVIERIIPSKDEIVVRYEKGKRTRVTGLVINRTDAFNFETEEIFRADDLTKADYYEDLIKGKEVSLATKKGVLGRNYMAELELIQVREKLDAKDKTAKLEETENLQLKQKINYMRCTSAWEWQKQAECQRLVAKTKKGEFAIYVPFMGGKIMPKIEEEVRKKWNERGRLTQMVRYDKEGKMVVEPDEHKDELVVRIMATRKNIPKIQVEYVDHGEKGILKNATVFWSEAKIEELMTGRGTSEMMARNLLSEEEIENYKQVEASNYFRNHTGVMYVLGNVEDRSLLEPAPVAGTFVPTRRILMRVNYADCALSWERAFYSSVVCTLNRDNNKESGFESRYNFEKSNGETRDARDFVKMNVIKLFSARPKRLDEKPVDENKVGNVEKEKRDDNGKKQKEVERRQKVEDGNEKDKKEEKTGEESGAIKGNGISNIINGGVSRNGGREKVFLAKNEEKSKEEIDTEEEKEDDTEEKNAMPVPNTGEEEKNNNWVVIINWILLFLIILAALVGYILGKSGEKRKENRNNDII